ncbi:MAG: type I restriction-modification system endonuclease, partial [Selenomonas sp.]|nr:type I restriction-modification system endonuclease [Selenomonas sp.]
DGLNLRPYQVAAIRAAETAVLNGSQRILLAMATGTGKTRTVLGMIYRFLKTGRFQRILFLVDRNSLGTQAHDVFKDVKLEELMSLSQIYNIKGLDEKLIDKETRVQVATVQGMIQRILYNDDEEKPAVSDYDLIIVDEAHRGYTLDKMMDEAEIVYRDQRDFQSKYRAVIEYFTAVKIALTATPALHTTQIFGEPVFKYTYREAVIDGFLVDYDAPHIIKTSLSESGIHYAKGDSIAVYDPATGEITNSEALEDELDFDVESFNRQIIVPDFNRKVLAEIAKDIDPTDENGGKTLIYAVNDAHADMIVDILREIYAAMDIDQDAIKKITGSIENGNQKKIQEVIRCTKNNHYPSIIVTVDLLTTGIDIPSICRLVFMRRVKSRILFEQMLGRATRLCPEIGKDHFEIYDPVGTFASLEKVSTMKPVVANPAATISGLIDTLMETADDDKAVLTHQIEQLLAKIQRKGRKLTKEQEEQFTAMTGSKTYADYVKRLSEQECENAKAQLIKDKAAFRFLESYVQPQRPVIVSDKKDKITYHGKAYGTGQQRPEDYLDEFTAYIKENINEVAALNIICTKPAELTRQSLKELAMLLDREGYAPAQLDSAITALNAEEAGADIISIIRRYGIGARLMNHREKVEQAVKRLKANHNFNKMQETWIKLMQDYLINEPVLNRDSLDEDPRLRKRGGSAQADKLLNGELGNIIAELNDYMYDDGGRSA